MPLLCRWLVGCLWVACSSTTAAPAPGPCPPRRLQGTLVFDRDATLYRVLVGSIRTVRDYVEGEWGACDGPGVRLKVPAGGALLPHGWPPASPPPRHPCTRIPHAPTSASALSCPRIVRPIFAHTTRQDGNTVVLHRDYINATGSNTLEFAPADGTTQ